MVQDPLEVGVAPSIFPCIFSRPGQSQGLLYKHLCDSFIQKWFVKITLQRRHALTVADGAFSHKIEYVTILRRFQIPKGIQIALLVQKLRRFCFMGGFCPLVKLHREGSVPAACTAGFLLRPLLLEARRH